MFHNDVSLTNYRPRRLAIILNQSFLPAKSALQLPIVAVALVGVRDFDSAAFLGVATFACFAGVAATAVAAMVVVVVAGLAMLPVVLVVVFAAEFALQLHIN